MWGDIIVAVIAATVFFFLYEELDVRWSVIKRVICGGGVGN